MELEVRYARRRDGARTAYGVYGQGPFLLIPPGFLGHIEWTSSGTDANRAFFETLAERRTIVLYDRHGTGMSDRKRTDFTAEDDMLDLYAVVDAAGADTIDIFGISFGGLPGVRFAAEHPERVRRLVLWGTMGVLNRSRFPEALRAQSDALDMLRRTDPMMFMKTAASKMFPSGVEPDVFQSFVKMNAEAATAEMQERLEYVVFDNLGLLGNVNAPALVMHRRGDEMVPFDAGQHLARRLRNARFVPLDGGEHMPYFGDTRTVLKLITEFLDEDAPPRTAASVRTTAPVGSGTAVILFTDIADSTALTERMGDAAFRAAARALDDRLRGAIRDAGGVVIEGKTLGDGVLATFASAAQAIEAARRCVALSAESELRLHVGLHAGDVIREDDNVYGGAVNIAARICGLSAAGEILVSGTIRDLARTSAGASFEDRGEHALKGIEEPVRVWAVR